jgi:hypothetical protein
MTTIALWLSALASVATAIGVGLLFGQVQESRRQRQADFERGFDDRYHDVVGRLPLPLLLDELAYDPSHDCARRAFYDYFELCQEELFYVQSGRISKPTWADWEEGISANLRKAAFRGAWLDLSTAAPDQFDLFRLWISHRETTQKADGAGRVVEARAELPRRDERV